MLQEKEGIDVKQIRLIHNGRQLADDKSMTAFDIQAGTTLHMVCAASKSKKKPHDVFFSLLVSSIYVGVGTARIATIQALLAEACHASFLAASSSATQDFVPW